MGVERRSTLLGRCDLAQAIGIKAQRPLGGDRRVKLAHRTRGRIARVDEGFLALLALARIQCLEIVAAHVDLASHFQHGWHRRNCRIARRLDPQGDLPDGAHILRDVLAHLIGIDTSLATYATSLGRISRANEEIVARARFRSRDELTEQARSWAESPALTTRPLSWFYLGDLAIHHQDILRGLGRERPIPLPVRDALLREGAFLGAPRLLRYRAVPTDGGRPIGRGQVVRGTSEALALWLTGRRGLEDELTFVEPLAG